MTNAERLFIPIAIIALVATALWWIGPGAWVSDAQPVRHDVFEEAIVTRSGDCATVDIRFNFTIQYLRHFPQDQGSSLYLQVRPAHVGPAAAEALGSREAVVARGEDAGPLQSIVYDGTTEGCPIVILDFDRAVRFSVAQGADFGSVRVAYSLSEGGPRCSVHP
jgi:hypothetical protein